MRILLLLGFILFSDYSFAQSIELNKPIKFREMPSEHFMVANLKGISSSKTDFKFGDYCSPQVKGEFIPLKMAQIKSGKHKRKVYLVKYVYDKENAYYNSEHMCPNGTVFILSQYLLNWVKRDIEVDKIRRESLKKDAEFFANQK